MDSLSKSDSPQPSLRSVSLIFQGPWLSATRALKQVRRESPPGSPHITGPIWGSAIVAEPYHRTKVPLSKTGAELLFEVFSQRYEQGSTLVTSNLPFNEWTEVFGSERLTGALLDRLTHHVHILEMNGESFRLIQSKKKRAHSLG